VTGQEAKQLLLKALEILDTRLVTSGCSPVEIRIVGGFALILHGIRETGFTQDIASMTRDFEPQVKQLIAEIGKELGLKLGWLNADMVLDDPEIIEMIIGETHFDQFGDYQALDVKVADLTTLLKLKIVAAGDTILAHDSIEYERHARDLVALLKEMNIDSVEKLMQAAPNAEEFPELLRLLFK